MISPIADNTMGVGQATALTETQRPQEITEQRPVEPEPLPLPDRSQEARTIQAAFAASLTTLEVLTVLRDPQDKLLPNSPELTNGRRD